MLGFRSQMQFFALHHTAHLIEIMGDSVRGVLSKSLPTNLSTHLLYVSFSIGQLR